MDEKIESHHTDMRQESVQDLQNVTHRKRRRQREKRTVEQKISDLRLDNARMKAVLELLENQSLQHGSKCSHAQRSPSRRSEDSETRTEKVKRPKYGPIEPEEVKERPECYEDDDDENLSFTNELKAMEVPVNFRMPIMDKYKETGDPSDHINVYKMKLQGQSPAVKCQNFHTTLISDAKRWYNKLKPGNIQSWPQLKRKFINAFIGNQTMIADITQLNDIQQKEEETVKSYFKRFNNVINKIETVTDEKALDALLTGLHMRTPFWRDVQNSQPKTYSQLVD
ncbi:Retrotrans gag domain-containing protein [Abeliophyllum distichum]|uniref:Retrotrans gag domain-containing protein n=1 Tax=Abeliophyllum distichum TaxID=126358 RepID=A0ABD1V8N1_9LAMI